MHNSFRMALSLSLSLTLPLPTLTAGCGDDEPQTLTASAFRDQANQTCTVGGEEIHQAFFSVVGTDAPTTDVNALIAQGHTDTDTAAAMGLEFFESDDDP